MPRIALQALLMSVAAPGIVTSITVDRQWLVIRRGPDELDGTSFAVTNEYTDPFGWVTGTQDVASAVDS